jgi:hypothetical protein
MLEASETLVAVALVFKTFISIALRGAIADLGLVLAFLREVKQEIVEANADNRMAALLHMYWVYALFTIAKKWEIDSFTDLMRPFAAQFNRPAVVDCIMLLNLERHPADWSKMKQLAASIEARQATLEGDISAAEADARLLAYFAKITHQRPEEMKVSLEQASNAEENQLEVASIIRHLSSRAITSGHLGRRCRAGPDDRGRRRRQVQLPLDGQRQRPRQGQGRVWRLDAAANEGPGSRRSPRCKTSTGLAR